MAQKAERYLLSRFAWLGCLALTAIAITSLTNGHYMIAAASLLGAAVIWTSPALPRRLPQRPWDMLNGLLTVALTLLVTASIWLDTEALRAWLFVVPLLVLGLLPPRRSVLLVVLFVAIILPTLGTLYGDPTRHQIISPLLLTAGLALIFFFLREYKARQLAPLRRTDELTQAASREYLSADLHKEIQRSEREGTDMSIIMLGLDAHLSEPGQDADLRALLPRIGRFLHSQLRDFDSYYRVADLQFLIILPGVPTRGASTRAEQLRKGLMTLMSSHGLTLSVSAGVAGLNIGDDAHSLQQSAASALQSAQKKGGDRIQSYSTWSHITSEQATTGNPLR